jgi:hypothetical protein
MTIMKIAVGVMDAVKATMTVQLAVNVMELALSLLNQMRTSAMTLTNWPFPSYPPIPWTKAQEQAYQQAQRAQLPEAPL